MNLIAAVDDHWGIGKENQLLFHIPEDMRFFRSMTLGKTVIMGRKTFASLPGGLPLPKRTNIVLSSNPEFSVPDVQCCHSLAELAKILTNIPSDDCFVIGGAQIYNQLCDYCTTAYITHVHAAADADCFFPDLTQLPNWSVAEISEPKTHQQITFAFAKYINHAPRPLTL